MRNLLLFALLFFARFGHCQMVNTRWTPNNQFNPFTCGSRCVDFVNGNDSNDGRTPSTAKKTIAAAVALGAIRSGETIGLARGSRFRENLLITAASGTNVIGYGRSGAIPIIDSSDPITATGWASSSTIGGAGGCWYKSVSLTAGETGSTNGWINVWENGVMLKTAGSGTVLNPTAATACEAAVAPAVYIQCAAGCSATVHNNTTFNVVVKPTGGVDPGTRPDGYYEFTARRVPFDCFNNTGNGCSAYNVTMQRPYDGDGPRFSPPMVIEDASFLEGGKHNIFTSPTNSGQSIDPCSAFTSYCGVMRRVTMQDGYLGGQSYTYFVLNANNIFSQTKWLMDGVTFSATSVSGGQQTVGGSMLCHNNSANYTLNGATLSGVTSITLSAAPPATLNGKIIYSDGTGIPYGTTMSGADGVTTTVNLSAPTAAAMVTATKIYVGQYGQFDILNSTSTNQANAYAACGTQFNLINSSASTTQKYFLVNSPTLVRGGSYTGSTVANAITLQQSNMADGAYSLDIQGATIAGGNPIVGQASPSPAGAVYTGVTGAGTNIRFNNSTITLTGANPKAFSTATAWNFVGTGNTIDSSGTTGGINWAFNNTPNSVVTSNNSYRTDAGGQKFTFNSVSRTWSQWYNDARPAGCTLGVNCNDDPPSTMSFLASALTTAPSRVITFTSTTGIAATSTVADLGGCVPNGSTVSSATATTVTISADTLCNISSGSRIIFGPK